jgi:TM2 domain-containing membrane protein YozV
VVAGLLPLLLGFVGAGRLCTGDVAIALAQLGTVWLVAAVVICGADAPGIGAFAWMGLIWPIIDGILMLGGTQRDSQGRRLR